MNMHDVTVLNRLHARDVVAMGRNSVHTLLAVEQSFRHFTSSISGSYIDGVLCQSPETPQ